MDIIGFNWGYLIVMFFNLMLVAGWIVLAILALLQLRRQVLPETARAIWTALILLIPLAGAIAYWIVRPGEEK